MFLMDSVESACIQLFTLFADCKSRRDYIFVENYKQRVFSPIGTK